MDSVAKSTLTNGSHPSRRSDARIAAFAEITTPVDPQLDHTTTIASRLRRQANDRQPPDDAAEGYRSIKYSSIPLAEVLNRNSPRLPSLPLDQNQHVARPRKSRRLEAESTRLLPRPPAREGTKTTLPPMLAPLHNPPVDAQVIPSISSDRFRPVRSDLPSSPTTEPPNGSSRPGKTGRRSKWSTEETNFLIQGVAKFGIGSWKKILKHPEYAFSPGRNSMDLKDRFRTCFPDEYRRSGAQLGPLESVIDDTGVRRGRGGRAIVELARLGLDTGMQFPKLDRRQRKTFTELEDANLLRGFQKHHAQWKKIQSDPTLDLSSRTRTDLRDRFRNRYPQLFKAAGYKHKTKKQPNVNNNDIGNEDSPSSQDTRQNTVQQPTISADSAPAPTSAPPPTMSEELELATLLLSHNAVSGTGTHTDASSYPPLPSLSSSGIIDPYDPGPVSAEQDSANAQFNRDILEWSRRNEAGPNASILPLSRILNAEHQDKE